MNFHASDDCEAERHTASPITQTRSNGLENEEAGGRAAVKRFWTITAMWNPLWLFSLSTHTSRRKLMKRPWKESANFRVRFQNGNG